jgi:outer membrane protein OmpA-like peptidoglycan-associated protein
VIRLPVFLLTRAARIVLILLGAAFIIYTVLGFWLVPRLVRSNLVGFASEQYHRTLSVGDIRFNPYTLVLEIRDLSLPDADGAQLLGYERLLLNFDISSVWKVGASFAAVELDKPYARVQVRPDRTLNLLDLTHLANPGPKSDSDSDETPRVDIDRLSVTAGRVAFEDRARARPFATELRPITFELRDFSTGGGSGNAYSLRAESAAGESFAWSGTFAISPLTSSGKFEVAALEARTIWSYLREALPFEFSKGVLNIDGEYSYAAGETGGLKLDVHKVSLADFGLRPAGKDYDYLEIAALALEGTRVDVRQRTVNIGSVQLDGGTLRTARDPEGRINLVELAGPSSPTPPPAAEAPATPAAAPVTPAPAWVVSAPKIAVSGMRVDFDDKLVQPNAQFALTPVTLNVSGLSTAPGAKFTLDLTAKGEKTGDLKVRAETDLDFAATSAHVEASEFNLTVLQPYLSTYTQIALNSGMLTAAMDLHSAASGALTAKGEVVVNKLVAIDNTLKQELLKWDRLTVSGIDYDSAAPSLQIARIDARAPYARLMIAPDQTLNITRLFSPAAGSTPPAVQTVRDADDKSHAPGGNPGAMRIGIAAIKVSGGSANFADYWIKPNYAVSLQELAGSISGLSSDPKSRAKVDLKGRVDRYAPAEIQGTMNLLSAALFTDIHVKFDGVELTSVTPYSGHFAGYAIEKGKLSIDVNYQVENRQLNAKQKFVIDQLELGDKVESPDAVKLPLKLAVALLKDRDGVIDLDLPMTGSLDDPHFRMGPLIWKAFIGLLGKIVTSPFALLAKLGGSKDEINQVDFVAGSPVLDAAGQERMTALAKALKERPSLELEVPTAYAPDADSQAISKKRLDEQLKALGATAETDDAARFDLLRKAFEKDLGAKTPLPAASAQILEQRKKKAPDISYDAANTELSAALAEKHPVSDAELGDLARARAQTIRDSLLSSGEVDAKRVFVLGIKPVAAVGGKVRVELTLK